MDKHLILLQLKTFVIIIEKYRDFADLHEAGYVSLQYGQ
jgi:hypothetical protein